MKHRIVGITGQTGSGKDTVADYLQENYGFRKRALADPIKEFGEKVFEFDKLQLWGPSECRNTHDSRYTRCEIRSSDVVFEPGCNVNSVKKVCDAGWGSAAARLLTYGPEWLAQVLPDYDVQEQMKLLCFWFKSLGHKYPELSPRIMLQHLGTEWGRVSVYPDIWIDLFIREANNTLENGGQSPTGVVCSDVRFLNETTKIQNAGGVIVRVQRDKTDGKATTIGIASHVSETEQRKLHVDKIIVNDGSLEDLYRKTDKLVERLK